MNVVTTEAKIVGGMYAGRCRPSSNWRVPPGTGSTASLRGLRVNAVRTKWHNQRPAFRRLLASLVSLTTCPSCRTSGCFWNASKCIFARSRSSALAFSPSFAGGELSSMLQSPAVRKSARLPSVREMNSLIPEQSMLKMK